MAGKYIVIEGTDCSGKETQSKLLEKNLKAEGINCIRLSFPVYDSPTGKIVGGDYLGKKEIGKSKFPEGAVNVNPYIACLYYAADRKYNIEKAIDYINKDYYVILDRYTSSNMAHQGSKIADKEERFNMYQWIDKLEYWLLKLPQPDLTIFLHMPTKYSEELKRNRTLLDDHEKDPEYLKRSEEAYLELAGLYNWSTIDCVRNGQIRTPNDINEELVATVKEKILIKNHN